MHGVVCAWCVACMMRGVLGVLWAWYDVCDVFGVVYSGSRWSVVVRYVWRLCGECCGCGCVVRILLSGCGACGLCGVSELCVV